MYWKNVNLVPSAEPWIPARTGLYAILRAPRVLNLPVEWEIGYVGKSLNLRRRFREHVLPWREKSQLLRSSPIYRDADWEFWYREVRAEELDQGERELIRRVQPALNSIKYGEKS